MRRLIVLPILLLLAAGSADAVSCTTGLTQEQVDAPTSPWSAPDASTYAKGNGIWGDTAGTALSLTGSAHPVCWDWGAFSATLTPTKDADTYYGCTAEHGYPGSGPCYSYHDPSTPKGIAPNVIADWPSTTSWTVERARILDEGDGIAIQPNAGHGVVRDTLLEFIHDDALEDDFCRPRDLLVENVFINRAFMAFAFDVRSSEDPPCFNRGDWRIRDSLVRMHKFAHSYKNRPGHGGVFKDANGGDFGNKRVVEFVDNVVLLGPVAGAGQVQFPPTHFGPMQCSGNVYLWSGTQADFDAMMATGDGYEAVSNQARVDFWHEDFPGCFTFVVKNSNETVAEFLARDLPELGGQSWDDLTAAWNASVFNSEPPPGCGIGPELALILPLIWMVRRRMA